ncbi:unnamed protein product [Cylindrotheca closterium]|uniref:HSF-type DNA-binding domain-containing protein n=1 Tax=Cylindrotheca closterium TaxID=2856 RepID=A0AAD2G2C9_9STRA|nr:unnamed protein product [Cylindrotheca closterium]
MAKFPKRLFELLKLTEDKGWEDIFSWVNDGTGFKVHDREKFEKVLLQKHFNTKRYASFARQLHAYGFDCVRTGRNTGIYSHPRFKRDDPKGSAELKRETGRNISKAAVSRRNQECLGKRLGDRFGGTRNFVLAGDTIVLVPSLLDTSNESDDSYQHSSSVMSNLYNTIRSQVADRTKKALIRIPSEATIPGADLPFQSRNTGFWSGTTTSEGALMNDSSGMHDANNTFWSPSTNHQRKVSDADAALSTNITGGTTTMNGRSLMHTVSESEPNDVFASRNFIHDDHDNDLNPIPLNTSLEDHNLFHGVDWDPIPLSPEGSVSDEDEFGLPNQVDSFMEPRPINEMVQDPATMNNWLYDSVPMLGTPRKRAMLEFSLPISLPIGFYFLDVSTYGIYWVAFLILGHFVECLFTSWGGAEDEKDKTYTKDLSIKPTIGMLQHHIMDLLWFHSLLSNMMLTPRKFGSPCFLLLYLFIWPQPFNLCMAIKTHYCESNLEGTYSHGKWWIGDIVKNVFIGYALAIVGVIFMHFYDMTFLRIPLVFGFNMIPLFAFESYRYLLSTPAILSSGVSDAKKIK